MTNVNTPGVNPAGPAARGRPVRGQVAVALAAVAVLAVAYAAWRSLARPVSGRVQALVEQVASEPARFPTTDGRCRVKLTGEHAGLTPHDEVYLTRHPDGSFVLLVPTFYGNGASFAGLLYTSSPLRDGDTYIDQSSMAKAQRMIDVPPYSHLTFDEHIDEHWYRVSYRMH